MKPLLCFLFLGAPFMLLAEIASGKTPSDKVDSKVVDGVKEPEKEKNKEDKAERKEKVTGHPFSWPFVSWEKMKPYGGTTKASKTVLESSTKASFTALQKANLSSFERDRRAILALAGDHRVSFDFIETASSQEDYKPKRPYFSWATERAFVIEDKSDFISIQHIMVMEFVDEEGKVHGPFTMKHWRQDWTYQDTQLLEYQGDKTWKPKKVDSKTGTWSQAVYQVDDSPRYETIGTWEHSEGLSLFRSETFWRPLPRREFSVRDDYNVLGGLHEITITPTGWLHTQINQKMIVEDAQLKSIVATEIGAVRYERITTPSQDKAVDYWEKTADFWKAVRDKWNAMEAGPETITLKSKVDDKSMYAHLFALAAKLESGEEKADVKTVIADGLAIIDRFLGKENKEEDEKVLSTSPKKKY